MLTGVTLRYLIGEILLIEEKVESSVEIREFSEKLFLILTNISDNCIMRRDFLSQMGLDKQFRKIVLGYSSSIARISEELSSKLGKNQENSENLLTEQKADFSDFLKEFSGSL